jgi:23S rRNA pseudouridine1911/1915/1917 synthase
LRLVLAHLDTRSYSIFALVNIEQYILFEDKDMIIIDKPAGLQVERDRFGHPSLEEEVQNYLEKYHRNHYLGIVHRIDRPVNGVIVLAKTLSMLKQLQQQMQEDDWDKIYRGVVIGSMPSSMGKIENYLLKDPKQKKALIFDEYMVEAKKSSLRYAVLEEKDGKTLLEIQLITGRYHQIRAQLGHMDRPIVGDKLYGSTVELENKILLQAYSLNFSHPKTGAELEIVCREPLRI